MKRKLYLAAFAAVAFASCNEIIVNEPEKMSGLVTLDLSVPVGETKSEGTEDERRVNNLQVYLFDSEGTLEAYNNVKNTTDASVQCTPGTKTVVAIVNAPEMKDISTYDDLKGRTSMLKDNYTYNFVMVGELPVEVTGPADVTIPVSRIAAKIILGSIKNEMALEYLKDQGLTIVDMFLINVAGSTGYMEDKTPELWYNEMKHGSSTNGSCADVLNFIKRLSSDQNAIKWGETFSAEQAFYAYPNSTETDSTAPEWCPRYTRLVVVARIGSDAASRYYYPISIPDIDRNTAYKIDLTITRPGSDSPDHPVDLEAASVEVNVVDWIDADDIEETI